MRTKRIVLLLVVGLMIAVGCEKKESRASDEIDFGTVENSIYQNKYFGLSIELPKKWSVQDQEAQKRIMDTGSELVASENKNLKAMLKASELQVVNLFVVLEHPVGSPVDYNPSIMCIAEKVRHAPGIKRGKDYHSHTKKLLESTSLQVSFPQEIYTAKLGGVDFDVMPLQMKIAGISVQQSQYVAIKKGYALVIIISYTTDEAKAELVKILETVTFGNEAS